MNFVRQAASRGPRLLRNGRNSRGNFRGFAEDVASSSHNDFARVTKSVPGTARSRIEDQLKKNKVVLYMKGRPEAPACGFSMQTVDVLDSLRVPYRHYDVLVDDDLRQGIKEYSAWPTIPQLYVNGEFIGGCDIVCKMSSTGELMQTLEAAGAMEAKSPSTAPK